MGRFLQHDNYKIVKNNLILLAAFSLISFIFLLLFSITTSPLYKFSYGDSANYMLMGILTKKGMIPYQDFWDHKGPLIIFIEYLGSCISSGKAGIFIIELCFFTSYLMGVFKTFTLFFNRKFSIILTLSSLILCTVYFKSNMTEEFCVAFLIWSIYFCTKYLKNHVRQNHNPLYSLLYGITFMVCILIRATNAIPLCGFVFIILCILVYNKLWKNVFHNIISFIIGSGITFLPFGIYFAIKGLFGEMFYATIIHNFKYVNNTEDILLNLPINEIISFIFPFICILIISITSFILCKNDRLISCGVFALSIIAIIFQLQSRAYPHYFYIWAPIFILSVCLLQNLSKVKNKLKLTAFIILEIGILYLAYQSYVIGAFNYRQYINKLEISISENANEIVNYIPENEKNSLIAYNVDSTFYITTDTVPCYKHFILQDHMSTVSEKTKTEVKEEMFSLNAKYIIINTSGENKLDDFLDQNYHAVKQNALFTLLERNKSL